MLDDWMQRRRGVSRDQDGKLAAAGRVHDDFVTQYLRHSYFGEPPPKSLDRNAFALELVDGLSDADGAATLAAFPSWWNVCGVVAGDIALVLRALREERVLSADREYQIYCGRVAWHLVPGVY